MASWSTDDHPDSPTLTLLRNWLTLLELGPCNVSVNLEAHLNPYSWNEVSNLLFLSQPVGTGKIQTRKMFPCLERKLSDIHIIGFSYSETGLGSINPQTGDFQNATIDGVQGRYPVIDASKFGIPTLG